MKETSIINLSKNSFNKSKLLILFISTTVRAVGSLRYHVYCKQIIYTGHLIFREMVYLTTLSVAKIILTRL